MALQKHIGTLTIPSASYASNVMTGSVSDPFEEFTIYCSSSFDGAVIFQSTWSGSYEDSTFKNILRKDGTVVSMSNNSAVFLETNAAEGYRVSGSSVQTKDSVFYIFGSYDVEIKTLP